ncbi:extensin family protein [Oceanicella sp. SM1341]|uniref:extensin-like domain-containing protein n=1 Tax=Oceanicella sp. SM1341 TaxID=1548889 RepID=UPI000E51CF10|nr:extensin family protein [Oceanicella sp. SM1341]
MTATAPAPYPLGVAAGTDHAPRVASRPRPRGPAPLRAAGRNTGPERITFAAALPSPRARTPAGAMICDDPRLAGQRITQIASAGPGCGIEQPVRVTEVSGVRLSRPITVNCRLASRMADWVEESAVPAALSLGTELVALDTVASYSCRPRNNQSGAKTSEHGRGNAVDIAGFRFANGREITVLDGWRTRRDKPFLTAMHKRACGPFGTVLGPNSDRYHRNHFHFDIAEHGNGAYCR